MAAQFWYQNIYVRAFDDAIKFYTEALGFKLTMRDEHGYARLETGSTPIGLAKVTPDQDQNPSLVGRFTGVGIGVEDLDAEATRLKGMGVDFSMEPSKQPWGGYMAIIKDPDGNELYLDQLHDE
jgi:lactoylglutathione lyase